MVINKLIHATCVAVDNKAVLLTGAPGSGKSDLALRLLDRGAQLVSDDQVELSVKGTQLRATAPEAIKGRMEIRGIGIVDFKPVSSCPVVLAVKLTPGVEPERLPNERDFSMSFLGISVPCYHIDPFHASADAKVRFLLASIT